MDKDRFNRAVAAVTSVRDGQYFAGGIGTLGEKTLHSVLKHYFEPDTGRHEVKLGGLVADILSEDGVIEIQTRQFVKLRSKLERFLERGKVTVVYPVARTKWLIWLDEATGEATKKRKSPKIGTPFEVFYELWWIRSRLLHPNLTLCVVLLDLEEYRFLNGWSDSRKKGSTRYDRIPVDIADELWIRAPEDYGKLVPASLGQTFTSKDFKKASGLSLSSAQTALNVLHLVGAVARTGKSGNSYVYERTIGKDRCNM
jgi:hypothetical protein